MIFRYENIGYECGRINLRYILLVVFVIVAFVVLPFGQVVADEVGSITFGALIDMDEVGDSLLIIGKSGVENSSIIISIFGGCTSEKPISDADSNLEDKPISVIEGYTFEGLLSELDSPFLDRHD